MRLAAFLVPIIGLAFACSQELGGRALEKKEKKSKSNADDDDEDEDEEGDEKEESSGKEDEDPNCQGDDCLEEGGGGKEPPGKFALLGPFGNIGVNSRLRWEAAASATKYRVTITEDDQCKEVLVEQDDVEATEFQLENAPTGAAFLCVEAKNSAGKTAAKNNAQAVTVHKGWVKVSTTGAPPAARALAMAWTGQEVYTFGGVPLFESGPNDKLFAYDPSQDKWREVSTTGSRPSADYGNGMAFDGKTLWLGQGPVSSGETRHKLDLVEGTWSEWTGTSAPAFRLAGSLTYADGKLFEVGGQNSQAKGFAYDPAQNAWSAIADAPVDRMAHCAVATDEELLLLMGSAPGGSAYDFKAKTWRTLSATGAPKSNAESPVRVPCGWDGKHVYVFTGKLAYRYDIKADQWSNVPLTGGPAELKSYATGTWAGEGLFVYGGVGSSASKLEAFMYYP